MAIGTDFDFFRALKQIDADPEHVALRLRNESRLAALKEAHRLYEERRVVEPEE